MNQKIRVSVVGPTGYTGLELLRLLNLHPNVEIKYLISSSVKDGSMADIWPHLEGCFEKNLDDVDYSKVAEDSDVVFLALPHMVSQSIVPELFGKVKIIDLSGDFRLKNLDNFEKFYGDVHQFPQGLEKFVYGLCEANRDVVKNAENVANPGCFATAVGLCLLPFGGVFKKAKIVAITGSSGLGKTPSDGGHHPLRNHNVKSYKIGVHQHLPEIAEGLGVPMESIVLVPTSGPFTRGIHCTAFICGGSPVDFLKFYKDSPFVRVKDSVQLADVIGSNFCDISVTKVGNGLIVQAVIDNLVKGAAGQAVQNMNLMFGLDEGTGLINIIPLFP